ncbi:MAG: chromosome segregation protein SMC [Archangium sp.]|nr:chromosome segregation protein SMC [Archangium sp.]MDP3573764.1 chromosome segregation protein SMC [Archangium sp.]
MLFLELAAQGVRGLSPSVRLALKPGYSALQSPSDLPAPLSGLIVALAFPDGRGGDSAFLAPGAKSGRAGLSIQGNDGSVWRIVRDLGGAGGLHKLNKATNQFDVVSQDALEMGQSLRAGAGFPARSTWEQLFTLTGPQLPTRRPKGPARPAAASATSKSAPRLPTASWNMDAPSAPVAEDPARLASLEAELVTSKRAAEVQFRLDGVSSELFTIESKMKSWEELKQRLETARAELRKSSEQSPAAAEDVVARAKRYPEDRKRHEEQLARLEEEQRAIIDNQPEPPAPLQSDQRFLGAIAAGLALLIGAVFLEGGLRYLAVGSMVPFTFAALLALRFIEDLQHSGRSGGKAEVLTGRAKKLADDFALTTMVVQKAFAQVGAETLDEFLAVMERRAGLQTQVNQLEAEWADAQSTPEYASLASRSAELKASQEACNEELLGMSDGYVRDVRDIEREIARLKEPAAAAAPVAPKPSMSGEGFAPVVTTPTETFDDPAAPLMMLATDLFTTDVPSLWSVLHDRAVQYLTALTDRRYHGISIDKDGHATLEAPGRTISARELPGKDLDLMYLALRLTLIEKAAGQHKLPVVIEDTFNTVLDAAKQPLFGRMVKHLGSLTQVLHVSGSGQNASMADTPAPI